MQTTDTGKFEIARPALLGGRTLVLVFAQPAVVVLIVVIGAVIIYTLTQLVLLALRDYCRFLSQSSELLGLLVLLPEVFYDCEAGRLPVLERGGEALEAVIAVGGGCHAREQKFKTMRFSRPLLAPGSGPGVVAGLGDSAGGRPRTAESRVR